MTVTYKKHPHTAGRIIDGVAFVITANDNRMHSLNNTAALVWGLAAKGLTLEAGAQQMVEEFEVDLATARLDVADLLVSLVNRQILIVDE